MPWPGRRSAADAKTKPETPTTANDSNASKATTRRSSTNPDGRTMRGHSEPPRPAARLCAPPVLPPVVPATAGACGEDEAPKPADINETGVDTIVGDLRILAVHVPAPDGERYPR